MRVRPFTTEESSQLQHVSTDPLFLGDGNLANTRPAPRLVHNGGIRKVINVVDDKMLIFDPPDTETAMKKRRSGFPNNTTARIREHRFVFDRLFDEDASQKDVYTNTTRPLLDSVLDGYNATVFAYGATGCGKTHTISGTPQSPGIIFLTMKELFEKIADVRDTKHVEVSLSYLEIYNETIRDLLQPSTKVLSLREDSDHRISVSNLSTHKPKDVEAVMEMILQGNQNRTISPTEANATSSRSHAVLQINIVQKSRTADISESHTFATLSIIDLAGSERASATRNRGERLFEGANINKSLLALGNCINALCDPRRHNHVPYRDSKLTRLLKFSLGGNCKTVMIVCVSPSSRHYDETLNTLKYADRAKKIKTKVIRNEHNLDRHVGSYLKMITEQKAEIEELRSRESKVINVALARVEKQRQSCQSVLEDALLNLRQTFEKTNPIRIQTTNLLKQMKLVISQISQLEIIMESYQESSSFPDSFSPEFMDGIQSCLSKLKSEREDLEESCISMSQDQQIIESTLNTLLGSLEITPGFSEADRISFMAQADAMKYKAELEIYKELAKDTTSNVRILQEFSLFAFALISQIDNPMEKISGLCNDQFFKNLLQTEAEYTDSKLSSLLNNTLKINPEADNSNHHGELPSPPIVVAGNTRRLSNISTARRRTKQQVVLVKSPVKSHKKAAQRIRWENGQIKLDPRPNTRRIPVPVSITTLSSTDSDEDGSSENEPSQSRDTSPTPSIQDISPLPSPPASKSPSTTPVPTQPRSPSLNATASAARRTHSVSPSIDKSPQLIKSGKENARPAQETLRKVSSTPTSTTRKPAPVMSGPARLALPTASSANKQKTRACT